jgi:hypothetical protein
VIPLPRLGHLAPDMVARPVVSAVSAEATTRYVTFTWGGIHGQIADPDHNPHRGRADSRAGGGDSARRGGAHWRESRGFTVIADHLNNPRGLSPAPEEGLYLAEAGAGGDVCVSGGPAGQTCLGLTGSLDRVSTDGDGVQRIVTGLISGSGPGGVAAEGPVSVSRGPDGTFFAQFGLSSHEVPPAGAIPAGLRVRP